MSTTASAMDFITWALQDLGVIAAGQTLDSAEAEDCRAPLNLLADALGIERLLLYKLVRTPKTLASGTASYTIGSGGDIDLERPNWIPKAGLILDTAATTPLEVPIDVLNDEEYAEWARKTQQLSRVFAVFYDRGHDSNARGTIYPLPIPSTATMQLVLYTPGGQYSAFANLDTEYTFPRGHGRAIRKNLALELAPMYPAADVSQDLRNQARASKSALKRAQSQTRKRRNDPMLVGGGGFFDMDSGSFRR